jgi:hypothetical protein
MDQRTPLHVDSVVHAFARRTALAGTDPRIPVGVKDNEWGDEQPTDIRVQATSKPASDGRLAAADRTDEYPMLFPRDLTFDDALPSFLEAHLELLDGPQAIGRFELRTVRTLIGRGQAAAVRLYDGRISKQHASIVYTGNEFRVRDEKSRNGTFLNGSQVVEYAIRDGDKLLVGDSILRFRVTGLG